MLTMAGFLFVFVSSADASFRREPKFQREVLFMLSGDDPFSDGSSKSSASTIH